MQNDVLKNQMAPWQEKGRWYKLTLKSDGTNITTDLTESDLNFTYSTGTFNIGGLQVKGESTPGLIHINDYRVKIEIINTPGSSGTAVQYPNIALYKNSYDKYTLRFTMPAYAFSKAILYFHTEDALI